MPKIQSYIPSQTYNKMTDIIDSLIQDGADRYEVNLSSLAAKLIDMGMVMYELQNKTVDNQDEQNNHEESILLEDLRLETLRSALRAELYSQGILQIAFVPEARSGSEGYDRYCETVQEQVEEILRRFKS